MNKNIYQTLWRCRNGSLPNLSSLIPRGSFVLLLLFGLLFVTGTMAQTCIQVASACTSIESGQYVKSGASFYSSTGNGRIYFHSDKKWYIRSNSKDIAYNTSSSGDFPPTSGWLSYGVTSCGADNAPLDVTVSQGECIAAGPCYTVTTDCGTIGGTYRDIGQTYGGKPDIYDEDGNDIYWGTDRWYIFSTSADRTVFQNLSTSNTPPVDGWLPITGQACAGASITVVLNPIVTSSVSIAANPSGSITAGTSVTFTATPTNGGTAPSYQWKKNGNNVGTNSATYTDTDLANGAKITCAMTSNATCASPAMATSNEISMTVSTCTPPSVAPSVSIAANPSGSITAGTSVTFTATPTNGGTAPSYQWKKNGNNVGTNSATYTDTDLANGAKITCVMTSNVTCTSPTTSNEIVMTVNPCTPPSPFSSTFYEQVSNITTVDDFDGGGVAYGNGKFVAVMAHAYESTKGYIFTSTDGVNWTKQTHAAVSVSAYFNGFQNVTFANGQFVAVGGSRLLNGIVQTSPDGVTWTNHSVPLQSGLNDIAYANGTWVVVGGGGLAKSTDNGITWTTISQNISNVVYRGVAYGNDTWVASGLGNVVIASNDLINWQLWDVTSPDNHSVDVTFGNGKFVAVRSDGKALTSVNGINWTPQNTGATDFLSFIDFLNGEFIVTDGYSETPGDVLTSSNGICWAGKPTNLSFGLLNMTYGNGIYASISNDGKIYSTMCSTPVTFTFSSSNTCVEGLGATLSLAGSEINYTYQLNKNGSLVGVPLVGTGAELTFKGITDLGSYTVLAKSPTGSCSATMTGTVSTVSGEVPVMGTIVPGCVGSPSTLSATAVNGSIDWYNANTSGTLLGNSASGATFSVSPTAPTTYYAQVNGVTFGTQSFGFTGGMQTFTVPAGVTKLTVVAKGASGSNGDYNGSTPGKGGSVTTDLQVTPGQVLNLFVGGLPTGRYEDIGGYNGGGSTISTYNGAGGGATDIRIGGTALTNRVVVAGGGGGSGDQKGGNGGGLIGQSGTQYNNNAKGGGGGTQTEGGAGGYGYIGSGYAGTLGLGGKGSEVGDYYGPGGGGGYYGGGGGGENVSGYTGGGGGGSSYTDPTLCSNVVHTQGENDGNGILTLTWGQGCISTQRVAAVVTPTASVTPSVNITASPGNNITQGQSVTFTATPTNGGTTPSYQWKKNGNNVGTNSNQYTDAALANSDKVSCVMTSNAACASTTPVTSNEITMAVTQAGNLPNVKNISSLVLGPTNCPGKVTFTGTGVRFLISGPGNYDNILPYRGSGVVDKPDLTTGTITVPGTYTIQVLGTAGQPAYTTTFEVTGTGCPLTTPAADVPVSATRQAQISAMGVTISPVSPSYTIAQSVKVTVTGGTPGNKYTLNLYDRDPNDPAANFLDLAYVSNSTGSTGNTFTMPAGQTSGWFIVKFVAGTGVLGTGRVFDVEETNASNPVDYASITNLEILPKPTLGLTLSPASTTYTVGQPITATVTGGIVGEKYVALLYSGTPSNDTDISQYLAVSNGQGGANTITWQPSQTSAVFSLKFELGAIGTGRIFEVSNPDFDHFIDSSPFTVGGCSPSVSITADPSGSITAGTSVTFTATPTNGGTTPSYQWKKNGNNVGTNSATYTDAVLVNGDKITCVMTSNDACASTPTATSNEVTMVVTNACQNITNRIYVTPTGTGNGSSWANATSDLQAAINNECGVTEIWVAAGTYIPAKDPSGNASPTDPRDKAFYLKDGIAIYGGFVGTETERTQRNPATNVTILSGDIGNLNDASDNCYHVVVSVEDGPSTVLDGLKIANGTTSSVSAGSIRVEGYIFYRNSGGGLNSQESTVTINNCTFENNSSPYGGAMYLLTYNNNSLISNCTFINNKGTGTNPAGAAVVIDNFGGNSSTFTDCRFISNTGAVKGGAIYLFFNGSTAIDFKRCVFANNTATNGGAVYQDKNTGQEVPNFENCLFVNNQASQKAGALYLNSSAATITNNTIYGNSTTSATETSGAIYAPNGVTISNSILWNNTSAAGGAQQQIDFGTSTPTISYSIVQGATIVAGTGNSNANPLFVNTSDPDGADNLYATIDDGLALGGCSPALNTGNNAKATATLDLLQNVRIQHTNVDMGAYERVTLPDFVTPSVMIAANPSGSITAGTSVTFTATPTNGGTTPTYIWKKNNVTIPNETGATLTTTTLADGDKIKVEMTSSDVCASSAMATSNEITVAVCSLPTAYNVTGGGPYCAGSGGSVVGLSSSQTGVNYQLKKDNVNVGSVVAGTGSAISFGNQTQAGLYTVKATTVTGGCIATMSGNVVVSVVAQPVAYNVTGGGSFCQGGSGVVVGLSGSETGVSYQLKKGGVNVGSAVAGTGSAISFGNQSVAGTYTVEAKKTGGAVPARIGVGAAAQPSTVTCTQAMTGSVEITVISLPTAYNVTGGGAYCAGGIGSAVGLSSSQTGVNYQLKKDNMNVGSVVAGTGNAISFGNQTQAGLYTVEATTATGGCVSSMSGNAVVTINTLPSLFSVTGGGSFCPGGSGVLVGLSGSETGVSYQLKKGDVLIGNALSGTGSAISFGNQTDVGTYTVVATNTITSCTTSMTGSASVTNYALPTAVVSGTSLVCKGGSAVTVTFTGSNGVAPYTFSYQVNGGSVQTVTTTGGSASATVNQSTSTEGVYTYTLVSVRDANCSQTQSGSAVVTVQTKPTIVLNTLQQTLNEGNTQVFCDTDANPVNGLQFTVSGLCVVGNPVWRVQVGGGSWSEWSATAPVTQLSNNQPHRYQAACDVSCPVTYTSPIELTINYRASVPQNVSLLADGVTVAAGETKDICNIEGNELNFKATCATGETVVYSVDGGEYSGVVPTQLVDGNYHNYRVRCRKSDGTASCVETESGVIRLRITSLSQVPVASLNVTSGCGTPLSFSGSTSCGSLTTIWYNASTNVSLSTLPVQTPSETTSYYARCQAENGCLSEKSNVVTFTVIPVHVAPLVTASQDVVCTGTTVTVSANCPAGSTTSWNTGVTTPSFEVAFSNVTKQSYWAKCVFEGGCQSAESNRKEVSWKAFVVSLINIGESKSATKINDRAAWSSQFITADGGPELDQSTQQSPTLYYVENVNKMAPRYWTIHADACGLGTTGSLTFDMLATPEMGVIRSFNTHENNAPYFMYANREGWTELYGPNHPAYGFYADNGAGGNVYDSGLPKGLYKLSIRYWDMKGWGSIYPSTRKPQGNVLAYQEYWFRIQSKDGVGVGAAREMAKGKVQGSDNGKQLTDNGAFATVLPNPVTNILRLKVQDSKGQMVQTTLTDAAGREVLSRQFRPETNTHQEEFGVSELPTGMYFLKVTTPDKQATLKVLKIQ
ncbi:glycine-rich protein [Runella sp. SP2]|uniref:glycine-rich protein n=1 Tax=Runella sp. SP2 TaxID=2268026 RepID=UPI0013DE6269|nr:glycine-rich protein [Runella sp. SP2]